MEGIHLRAARVARGGIRHSDRPDDFRAEILGLMRTQVIKNAVIVPAGAKGGFAVKHRAGTQRAAGDAERAYRTLIEALLSITDTIENGRVISPRGQMIYDEPDPYLVVAADKGTAQFSDIANSIAVQRGFWLGDAFASGGATGYDHKQLAITARGAWESVRQHFRELGRDVDREPVAVVGIGDMSGDVFGNGVLRARTLLLRAAFNHRHVFLDPAPDPDRAFRERERLFRLRRSGWDDYDPACISPGGGVYRRDAKVVDLSPAARAMLDLGSDPVSGEDLVRAVLSMEADLLWNGGIGTYVKASDETHAEIADSANDAVRIDARQLRVRVVAEGGNLGFTQRARIEFALADGRLNTDAIDNSGGVDCSDHEVNLKIALQPPVARRELTVEQRNALLAELAGDVCERVLAHNRRQALRLSLDQASSRTGLSAFRDLMASLEETAGLNRRWEQLPTREDLRARRSRYVGLTRPELAVLLAFTKLDLQRRLLASPLCDAPELEPFLCDYFPDVVNQRFGSSVRQHPLRREIIAVELANRLIDTMGMTFLTRLARDTGRDPVDLVAAWTVAMAVCNGEDLLERLMARHTFLAANAELACRRIFEREVENATRWVVETHAEPIAPGVLIDRFEQPARSLLRSWPELQPAEWRERHRTEIARLVALGLNPTLADDLTRLTAAQDLLEIALIATALDRPPPDVAQAYLRVGALADLDWMRRALPAAAGEDRWEQRALGGLLEELLYARRQLCIDVLSCEQSGGDLDTCMDRYAEAHAAELARLRGIIADLKAAPRAAMAGMLVAMHELGRLVRPAET